MSGREPVTVFLCLLFLELLFPLLSSSCIRLMNSILFVSDFLGSVVGFSIEMPISLRPRAPASLDAELSLFIVERLLSRPTFISTSSTLMLINFEFGESSSVSIGVLGSSASPVCLGSTF